MGHPHRIAIVGAGHVGATTAYALLLSGLTPEIVLVDRDGRRAEGEAMDLAHAVPFADPVRVWAGTWDEAEGERPRVTVTLATGIPEDVVRGANLGHLDPREVDVAAFEADPGTLVVPQAGEVLFRLR